MCRYSINIYFLPYWIVVRSERVAVTNAPSSVTYPRQGDLDNFTMSSGMSPAMVTIPAQFIAERANCKWQLLLIDMEHC